MDPMDKDTSPSASPGRPQPPPVPGGPAAHHLPSTSASGTGSSSTPHSASGRRRGLDVVTQNACTECRKKRAKCDGKKPCARCKTQKVVECVYEVPVRQSKESLRHENEQLRRRQRLCDQVLEALARPDNNISEDVLFRLRNRQSIEVIWNWLNESPGGQIGGPVPYGGGPLPSIGQPGGPLGGPREGPPGGPPVGPLGGSLGGSIGGSGHGTPIFASFPSAPLTTYGYAAMALGMSAPSPNSSRYPQTLRRETDQPSPWSSYSHLARRDSHADTVHSSSDATRRPPLSPLGSWPESHSGSGEFRRYRGLDRVLSPELSDTRVPPRMWSMVTSDALLVQHLLALYFCWEYPTFALLSKAHFLGDFVDGRTRYCSSILVNALLALGCRFSNLPDTRADANDPTTSGDHFFTECLRLFHLEKSHHSLTTIQALGIMSIREASCGHDSESCYYAGQSARLAVEMGLHMVQDDRRNDDESEVQAATFWGAFALDHAWSLATGSLPKCSRFLRLPPKPAVIDDIETALWFPYTDDGEGISPPAPSSYKKSNQTTGEWSSVQPSNVRSVYKCFCEISELVHESLYILYSPGMPIVGQDLLDNYQRYLDFSDSFPDVLQLDMHFTPAVLFARMYHQFVLLLLFRPFIQLAIVGSNVNPRERCLEAAREISSLIYSYSRLYTLKRTPSFVPYFVLASGIIHLTIGADIWKYPQGTQDGHRRIIDPGAAKAYSRCIADLTEMTPCHLFAVQALNHLRFLPKKWNIDIDIKVALGEEHLPAVVDPCEATHPVASSLNFLAPNPTGADFDRSGTPGHDWRQEDELSEATEDDVDWNENAAEKPPWWWPFTTNRPIMQAGDGLIRSGFRPLDGEDP
ncbi:fungal-specific transcription factor domain-containing protein [Podospora appendiculata]|uniref:Fungal-specific transcription factor domain-containing protein n=1 Tax=Podospora appendiculata TaxID=314037 RepID=A0AAE0XIQ8_9PEZI|nr:fungal-specific transcription factor domain-containing protein [Podospora appendiculata]